MFDFKEPFIRGHQIINYRPGAGQHERRLDNVPSWMFNELTYRARLTKVLLRSFPKLETDPEQRQQAAIWARVIYLYWLNGSTQGEIAAHMELKESRVKNLVRSIRRALSDRKANGKPRGFRRTGRPRTRIF